MVHSGHENEHWDDDFDPGNPTDPSSEDLGIFRN